MVGDDNSVRVGDVTITRVSNVVEVRRREDAERIVHQLIETGQLAGDANSESAQRLMNALLEGSMVLVRQAETPRVLTAPQSDSLLDLAGGPSLEGAPELAFISIALEEEDGGPVAKERYIIVPASGSDLHGDLDDAGEARHDGIAKGTATVSFPDRDRADWFKLGEIPFLGRGKLDVMLVSEDGRPALGGSFEFSDEGKLVDNGAVKPGGRAFTEVEPGEPEEFQLTASQLRWWTPEAGPEPVDPKVVDGTFVCEFEDLLFNLNSPVMLPTHREDPNAPLPQDRITGLGVLATVLQFLEVNDRSLLAVGHTDTSGTRAYNLKLSGERAATVLAVLRDDKAAWADIVTAKSYKVDWKAILKWTHDTFGWACDPGPIDETDNSESTAARDAFRARYEAEFGVSIPAGEQSRGDWEAYFDLYQRGLARLLGLETAELASTLAGLEFTEPASLACGESWPREQPGKDSFVSAANRRVELWLLEPDEVRAVGDAEPVGVELYGPGSKLKPRYLSLRPTATAGGFELSVVDANQAPMAGATVHLAQDGVEFQVSVTDAIGRVFVEPPGPGEVTLTVDGHLLTAGPGTVEDAEGLTPDGVHVPRESETAPERVC